MTRKASRRRKAGKGIVTTKRAPKWKTNVNAAWKGLTRQAKSMLAGAGLIWIVWEIAKALGGG